MTKLDNNIKHDNNADANPNKDDARVRQLHQTDKITAGSSDATLDDTMTNPLPTPPGDQTRHGIRDDPLLAVLQFLTTNFELPFSSAIARQGLPLENSVLAIGHFEDAAENLGLKVKLVNRKPTKVSPLVYPFVVLFKNGDAGVALSRSNKNGTVEVQIPGSEPAFVSPKQLDQDALATVGYVSTQTNRRQSPNFSNLRAPGHWLWSVVGRFWPNWLNIALTALLINLLALALPLFVMNVYDRVIPNNSISTLWALAAGVLIALVFDFGLRMMRAIMIDNSGRRIDMKVSSLLFKQALDVKMADRLGRAGDLANQIREFETVRDFFTSASISSMIDLFFISLFLLVLWLIVGPLALVPMIAVPIVIATTLLIQYPLAKSVAQAQETTSNRHSVLVESLVGIETVKAISAEGVLQGRWDEAVASSVWASSAAKFWSSLAIYFTLFVQQLVSVGVIVWGVFLVADNAITIGALIASNILAGRVLAPLSGIAMTLARAQQSFASLKQLNHLMRLEGDHHALSTSPANLSGAAIQIKDLQFTYPQQDQNALDIQTLNISPGERIGIVGRVGSGKSTIGKLLAGLFQANAGTIVLGGSEINQYAKADLRRAVAYVGQDAELFSGNLQQNILFTQPYDENKFTQAVNVSGVALFAQNHPHGYEMQVGERGKFLSGGQRQAVSIARMMMGYSKLLFLDEPTSGMDNLSEAAFIQALSQWLKSDTTLIVATHRNSLLAIVDRILVLDKGKLIADGPREVILKQLNARPNPAGKPRQRTKNNE